MGQVKGLKAKILIADGMEKGRVLWNDILGAEYELVIVQNGPDALKFLQESQEPPALVMLDFELPGMDGFSVLEELNRKHRPEFPVIMIFPEEYSEWRDMADDDRVAEYISRNIGPAVLRKRIANILLLHKDEQAALGFWEEKNHRLKYVDELTGCPNWEGFRSQVIARLQEGLDHIYGIWYMDIRRFKFVNVTFGYDFGNRLLQYVARTLEEFLHEDEFMGRIAADCFVVFARMDDHEANGRRMKEIWEKVNHFFDNCGQEYKVSQCSGVYILQPEDIKEMDVDRMLDMARIAHKSIKNQNDVRNAFYNEQQWKRQQREIQIINHLGDAIRDGEISVWLQPQFDYSSDEMTGAEALCRWNHATLGWISPGEFIPLLEESGQITELDMYIWETACRYLKEWKDRGDIGMVPLSVNVSRIDILKCNSLEEILEELLQKYDLDVSMLRVEITENVYMEETDTMLHAVRKLHDKGFSVEMDDFGSGFSSLNMLKDVPLDTLKLDLGFVRESGGSAKAGNIISSIIRMAHSMEMPVIAEGVEQAKQADFLRSVGCNVMQGYYFAKPMPKDEFEVMLRESKVGRPRTYKREDTYYLEELFDSQSNSSYLFNYCIGGAAFICFDGRHLESIMANEEFFATLGGNRQNSEKGGIRDILTIMTPEDKELTVAALNQAIETGKAQYVLFHPYLKQYIRYRLRYLYQREIYHFMFCQVDNITQERIPT